MSLANAMAVKMFESLVETKDEERVVIFLVDGSGSVPKEDFVGPMKNAIKALSKAVSSDKTRFGIIQFSHSNSIELDLTGSLSDVNAAVTAMEKIGGTTRTKAGVKAAREMGESSGNKVILIIITDGVPDADQYPDSEIQLCKNSGISVYALGIGQSVGEDVLRSMSTGGDMFFTVRNYKELEIILESLSDKSQAIAEQYLRFEFRPAGLSMIAGQPMHMLLNIRNAHPTITIPSGLKLYFEESEYFFPTLVITDKELVASPLFKDPNSETELDVYLEPKPAVDVDIFPGEIIFNYNIGGVRRRGSIILGTGFLRGDFETEYLINVLLFGWKGTGKSALLNSLVTSLSMTTKKTTICITGSDDAHVTNNYQKIWVGENIKDADNPKLEKLVRSNKREVLLQIFDPWGDSDSDYKTVQIKHLLQGQIPPGVHRNEVDDKLVPPELKNTIYTVCFVVPLGFVMEDPELIKSLKKTMKAVIALRYEPMLVVTRVDDVENIQLREQQQDQLLAMLPILPSNVIFHENYHAQDLRINSIDLSSRKILSKMYNLAESKINQLGGGDYLEEFEQIPETRFTERPPKRNVKDSNKKPTKDSDSPQKKNPDSPQKKNSDFTSFLSSNGINDDLIEKLVNYQVSSINDIPLLEESDWESMGIGKFPRRRIIDLAPKNLSEPAQNTPETYLVNLGISVESAKKIVGLGIEEIDDLRSLNLNDISSAGFSGFQAKKTLNSILESFQ
jgi:hypothetical protein